MQGEGFLLLPRSYMGTILLLLDLRPEAGYTFAPLGSRLKWEILHIFGEILIIESS